ncbi:rCG59157 [Rattus norvegicus]|uniref:RCG59157 n=1 Tax=Rattus norvegicus TaxID=10116 RepID=A6KIR1_RAT|nr:rCG59157 [Rattus norvegicus]
MDTYHHPPLRRCDC